MIVKIKKFKERPPHWSSEGCMDKYMGKTISVQFIEQGYSEYYPSLKYRVYDRKCKNHWYFCILDFTIVKKRKVVSK